MKKIHSLEAARSAEQRRRDAVSLAYEAQLQQEHAQLQARLHEEYQASFERYFQSYDANGDGVIDRDELRDVLTDLRPDQGEPSEEVLETLLTCTGTATLPSSLLLQVTTMYVAYLEEKEALHQFFCSIDLDGSGTLEPDELLQFLRSLGARMRDGPYVPVEADVAFLYDACRVEHGAPISGAALLLLRTAIAEWKRMIERRLYEQRVAANRARRQRSAACSCAIV